MIAEMYHTSSLYHDDVIDKAELRRNRPSVNKVWGQKHSVMGGNYAIATSNILLGQLHDPDVSILKDNAEILSAKIQFSIEKLARN